MVTSTYEWPAGKWLFQGLMASLLSGVGFVFLTLVFEYGKRYRRKSKEREQQVILEKLLRGDVVLDWRNPSAVVPVNEGCILRERSSSSRGSFLINNYKQYGGFLGVGRGYYGGRYKPAEESHSDTQDTNDRKMTFTRCAALVSDVTQSLDSGRKNSEPTVRIVTPSSSSFTDNEEARIFQNMITSPSTLSACSVRKRESTESTGNNTGQSRASKTLCEEVCYRIVKEHPFIAPFIRHDLLHELRHNTPPGPTDSNSGTVSNLANIPKKWLQMCTSLYQPANIETPPAVRSDPKIKKRARSMSRYPQLNTINIPTQLEKRESLVQKAHTGGVSKKSESAISKKISDIKPDNQRLSSTASTARYKHVKNMRSRRSISLCRKPMLNCSDASTQLSTSEQDAKVMAKQGSTDTFGNKYTANVDNGSSVDPLKASSARITEYAKSNTNNPENSEQERCSSHENQAETASREVSLSTCKQAEQCGASLENNNSAEGRINDIVSALTSWGYTIKNKVQRKDMEPATTLQENEFDGSTASDKLSGVDNTTLGKLDSKALIDMIKNLAESRKNRKLLRQISTVLNTSRTCGRMSRNRKSFTRSQASPSPVSAKVSGNVKSPATSHVSKETKNSNDDTGSNTSPGTNNRSVVKRRRIVRERSYVTKLSLMYKREGSNDNDFNEQSVLPATQTMAFSSSRLLQVSKNRQRRCASPRKKQSRSPQRNSMKRFVIKKMEPRGLKKLTKKSHSQELKNLLYQQSFFQGDGTEATVEATSVTNSVKPGNEISQENPLETQYDNETKHECISHTEDEKLVMNINEIEKVNETGSPLYAAGNTHNCLENNDNNTTINNQRKSQTERESQTPDIWVAKHVACYRMTPSPENKENIYEKDIDDVCVVATQEKQTTVEATTSQNKDNALPVTKEVEIRSSDTLNKELSVVKKAEVPSSETLNKRPNTGKPAEPRYRVSLRKQGKQAVSKSATKSPQVSVGDVSEKQLLKSSRRGTGVDCNKLADAFKGSAILKKPSSMYKSGLRKSGNKAETAEKQSNYFSPKAKEQPMRTFVKNEHKTNSESRKRVLKITHEKSQAVRKEGGQKTNEARSRFGQYQKNQQKKNALIRHRASPVTKHASTERNQNINKALLPYSEPGQEADGKQLSGDTNKGSIIDHSLVWPVKTAIGTSCSMPLELPEILADPLATEDSHNSCQHVFNPCFSLGNNSFDLHSQEDPANETGEGNINQQPVNILRKSKLDALVNSIINSKSIFSRPAT